MTPLPVSKVNTPTQERKLCTRSLTTEPFKGHGDGKKFGLGVKNICTIFWILSQTLAFPRETLCSLTKRLRSLAKPVELTRQTLPVYFTACSGSYSYVHNEAVHRVLF